MEQITLDDGRVVAINLAPVFLRSQFLGTVSIFRDITHEVQVDRLKSEFVANVSHELRTPMTSIKGYVEVLLMGAAGPLNEQQTRFLHVVRSNTQRLNVLVNDLLDVSRVESGRAALTFEPLDLEEIAQEVIDDLKRRSLEENKAMNFYLEVQPGLRPVLGDEERIRQVMNNLMANSYNYTPVNGQVTIQLIPQEQDAQVNVIDNGVGIPLSQQSRVFQRFHRGDDPLVLATAGTGLGLSISKTLVEMHHGKIWFSSSGKPGEGSIFSFTLPWHQAME
jgi:signal transduction histidine kinase